MTTNDEKKANSLFFALMDRSKTHLRIGAGREDHTEIRVLGTVAELHGPGPKGVCTCCHGRGDVA